MDSMEFKNTLSHSSQPRNMSQQSRRAFTRDREGIDFRRQIFERANEIKERQMRQYREQLQMKYSGIVNHEVIEKIPASIANSLIKENFIKMRKNLVQRTIQAELMKKKFQEFNLPKRPVEIKTQQIRVNYGVINTQKYQYKVVSRLINKFKIG
ncbi:UNKNOWN [Stylonychia lemnae]|uniref:Uncharacterized protein n=1 Tax=Stylonychia lemnae TaxID=5949 RepID=A0A078AVV7_STYLE|nr:UNKNOWN [Stylonychia lemnae]|eukprot:CDW86226.1 UNKNOWN [Stylonychia lemnae]